MRLRNDGPEASPRESFERKASYESNDYRTVSANFETALEWMTKYGANPERSRLGRYRLILNDLVKAYTAADFDSMKRREDDFMDVLFEVHEVIEIHRGLRALDIPGLSLSLKKLFDGPMQRKDELSASRSIIGRNTAFELLVASRFARAGLAVDISRVADVIVKIDNRIIYTECKRPSSPKKILSNLRSALTQCRNRIAVCPSHISSGIAAIDFSWAANPQSKILELADFGEIDATLTSVVNSFIEEFAPQLWLQKKTLGILVRFSGLIVNSEKALLNHAQQWGFIINSRLVGVRAELASLLAQSILVSTS